MAKVIQVEYQVKGLDGLTTELTQASTATEQLNQDLDKTANATTSAKAQLRQMNNELATMIANGDTSSQKFKELTQRAGQLSDAIQDASGYIKTAGSDTSGLDKALRATNVLVGGFAAVQGATALFGKESENLQKTLLKVNAAMSILAGLQTIQEELSKKDSILTAAATKAKLLYTAATSGATAAVRLLRIAILGLVGGAVISGIVLLVKNWQKITDAIGITNKAMREFEQSSEAFAASTEQRNKGLEKLVKTMELAGKTQQEINAATKEKLALDQQEIAAELKKARATEKALQQQKFINTGLGVYLVGEKKRLKALEEIRLRIDELELSSLDAALAVKKIDDSFEEVTPKVKKATKATEEFKAAIDPKRLNQWERAFQAVKEILGEGGESLAGRLKRLREEAAALNKEVEGGGGRTGATGVDPVVETFDKRTSAAQGYLALITDVNSQIDNIIQQSQDAQLARLEAQRAQGLITEKQYIQKVQALKKKQAEQDKKLSIFNILLNTAQAVSKALTAGPIIGPILAGIIAALGAAELAIAKRTPIPAFRKGVIDLQGPGTATSDSITARLSKGESVMTAEETKNHRDVLLSIRKKQFDRMYMPVNEVLKKNKPMSIPAAQLSGHIDINGGMAVKLDKIYEELVYNNLYTREGNRHTYKIRQAVTKARPSNGIRV